MATKPKRVGYKEVSYRSEHWNLLRKLREEAKPVMSALDHFHLRALVYGSIARGDVSKNSDIDVFVPDPQSSFLVETALENAGINVNTRLAIQATPNYAMKAHVELSSGTSVSFPLMHMRRVEQEFYRFGGELDLTQLNSNLRVPGVDKRLMLIEPTEKGHVESSIVGREEQTASILGISAETVFDRVHTLLKRDKIGRTGVFLKRELSPEENFEMVLRKIVKANPAVRRRLKSAD